MKVTANHIFSVTESNFEALALQVYRQQYAGVWAYHEFCRLLRRTPDTVNTLGDIPFLPVEVFKTHSLAPDGVAPTHVFESSATTGAVPSKHGVTDIGLYEESFIKGFEQAYGPIQQYAILALLPSYLERGNSSLVYMAQKLIQLSGHTQSGFFLNEWDKLAQVLTDLQLRQQKTILLGVTFGLLDFAERHAIQFPQLVVMETGGMKGRRAELTRYEVHQRLQTAFGVSHIHSEYGMTELLSQAYATANGLFTAPPWMKVAVRDVYDPLSVNYKEGRGGINVIDLANLNSCSFIATGDVGQLHANGTFEITGRLDSAEVRGCNLMVM